MPDPTRTGRAGYLRLALNSITSVAAQTVVVPVADSHVNTDVDARRNDNYGCGPQLYVGATRGGGGLPYGSPDGVRSLIRFDLSAVPDPVGTALLRLTIANFNSDFPQTFVVDVCRILEPWEEGNGNENSPPQPDGCESVDDARGVAWVGSGDGGDANNQTQPDFDLSSTASAVIVESTSQPGDVVTWDITPLVQAWLSGSAPNHGLLLRDTTSEGAFKGVFFGSRQTAFNEYPTLDVFPGPELHLYGPISTDMATWGSVKAMYR